MKDEKIDDFSNLIGYLKVEKKIKMEVIANNTKLSRATVSELYNKGKNKITAKVYHSFKSAYPQEFEKFILKPEQEVITATKKEFEDLKATVAKMAEELINLSQDKRALIEENKNLRDEISRLKK